MAELSFAHDPAERSRSARRQHRSREGQRAPRDFALAGHYGLAAETVADWGKKTAGPLPSSDDPWGTLVAGSVPHTEAAIDDTEPGEALAPEIRERLERRLGYDLGRVRLYTRHKAQRATSELGARAFAFGERIFLRHPKERSDLKLLAHELTHSVQQGALGRSPSAPTRNSAMAGAVRPSTGAAGVRQQDPHRVAGATATPSPATHPSQGATQGAAAGGPLVQGSGIFDAARSLAGRVVSRAGRTVGTVVETVGNLAAGTRNAALSTVRRLFPNAYALFMEGGISGFLRRLIGRAVRSVRDAVRSRLRDLIGEDNFSALGEFAGVMGQIVGDLAQNNCSTVLRLARRFGDFMRRTFAPIVNRVRCWGRQLSTFISGLWDSIAGPVWSFIQDIGGPLWESVRGFMASLGTQLRRLRAWLGASWETVKGWLGIEAEGGEAEGGGIWNWITSVASDIWAGLRETLRPVMGPLRVVGGIFLALSPVGPLLAVILLWPRLQQAFSWLSARWDDFQGLLGQAREFFANTVLPQLLDGAQSMANLLADGAAWLIDKLNSITGLLARLASDQLRNSPFAPLASIVDFFRGRLQARLNGLKQGIRRVAGATRSGILRLIALGRRVLAVLIEILAVVLNPFGIAGFLLGMAWRLLPECLKGPIINFVVNLLIGVIEFLPPLFPPLGLLWPFIQQGLLGFLREVQCQPTDRKVRLANKVASIISGGSVEFFLGFMRGLVVGVLEGIFSPLTTIAQIFELPTMIRTFLQSLSLSFSQLVQRVRCLLRDMGQRAMGTLSDILTELSALLTDPGRVIALIGQAICSALNTVRGLGRSLATQMFQFFEQPDSQIGNSVGRAAGNLLVDAIYAFFSAGSTSVLSALRPVLNALGSVGRTILRSAQQLVGHLRRLTREVRRMVDTFVSRARTAASGAMARLKAFFGRIFAWFQGTFRGLFRRVAGNADDVARYLTFKLAMRAVATQAEARRGLRRHALQSELDRLGALYRTTVRIAAPIALPGSGHWHIVVAKRYPGVPPIEHFTVLRDPAAGNEPLGRTFRFTTAGEQHRFYLRVTGRDATAMLRSVPTPLTRVLASWRMGINEIAEESRTAVRARLTQAENLLQQLDTRADIVAAARARERQVRAGDDSQITAQQRTLLRLIRRLFQDFAPDRSNVAGRFRLAPRQRRLDGEFTSATWASVFRLSESTAREDLAWGDHRNKVETNRDSRRYRYRLKLDDGDLIDLATRVILQHGRRTRALSERAYFTHDDILDFCTGSTRGRQLLPNDRDRYNRHVLHGIGDLLLAIEEVYPRRDGERYIFSDLPSRRCLPPGFAAQSVRSQYYEAGSGFDAARTELFANEHPKVTRIVNNLKSNDLQRQARGETAWRRLVGRTGERLVGTLESLGWVRGRRYRNQAGRTRGEVNRHGRATSYQADHIEPLARHWLSSGHNSDKQTRRNVAGDLDNLQLMERGHNASKQAGGAQYSHNAWVGPNFTSQFTERRGPQWADNHTRFTNYR